MNTLDDIDAHIQIQQALARYCRGLDRGDPDMILSAYHPGAMDRGRVGHPDGPVEALVPWVIAKLDLPRTVPQHHVTNILVQRNGDVAHVESYFLLFRPQTNPDSGDDELVRAGGRYLDRFERRNGKWLIAERRVILDWSQRAIGSSQMDRGGRLPLPGRRERDPSWEFLSAGTKHE